MTISAFLFVATLTLISVNMNMSMDMEMDMSKEIMTAAHSAVKSCLKGTAVARAKAAREHDKGNVAWAMIGSFVHGDDVVARPDNRAPTISTNTIGKAQRSLMHWALPFIIAAAVAAAAFLFTIDLSTMAITSTLSLPAFTADIRKKEERECTFKLPDQDEPEQGYVVWVWGVVADVPVQVYQVVDSDRIPVAQKLVSDIEYANEAPSVSIPKCGTLVKADGKNYPSPSARVSKAVGRHIDSPEKILEAGFEALLYRQEEGKRLKIASGDHARTISSYEHEKEGPFTLGEEADCLINQHPVMQEIAAAIGVEVKKISLGEKLTRLRPKRKNTIVTNLLDGAGYYGVGIKDDSVFVVESLKDAVRVFRLLDCERNQEKTKYSLVHTPEVLRRAGALLGRKGIVETSFISRGSELPEELDGTLAVLGSIKGILQGTAKLALDKIMRLGKGVIRPPVRIGNVTEEQGYASEAEFGREMPEGHEIPFVAFDHATEESASLNQQLVAFSTADQGQTWYQNLRLQLENGIEALMSDREEKWYELGFDLADILPDRRLKDFARKFPLDKGYRAMAIGVGRGGGGWMLDDDEILLPRRKMREMDLEKGDVVRVARDPGQPDGKSIREFTVAGALVFSINTDEVYAKDGVALSANSQKWLDMGGDFDGDSALVWPKGSAGIGELKDNSVDTPSFRKDARGTSLFERWSASRLDMTLQQALEQTYSIGQEVNKARRLWLLGLLDDTTRGQSMGVAQGAIDAMKHLIDMASMKNAQEFIQDLLEDFDVGGELDLIGVLSSLKNLSTEKFDAEYIVTKEDKEVFLKIDEDEQNMWIPEGMLISSADGEQLLRVEEQRGDYLDVEHVSGPKTTKDEFFVAIWTRLEMIAENVIESEETGQAAKSFAQYLLTLKQVRRQHIEAREGEGKGIPEELATRLRFKMASLIEERGKVSLREEQAEELYFDWAEALSDLNDAETEKESEVNSAKADRIMDRTRTLLERGKMSPAALMSVDSISTYFITRTVDPFRLEEYLEQEEEEEQQEEEEDFFAVK